MSRIVIDIDDGIENYFKENCCGGNSIQNAVLRLIVREVKSKKLQSDLRDGGQ